MPEYAWLPSLDFSQDADVIQERPVRQPIRWSSELTAAEKAALLDLLQAGAEMLPGAPLPVTQTHFDRLMKHVFSDKWNSRIGGAKYPKLPGRKFKHTTLPVGTLKEDLPPRGTATASGEA
ncbi:hypothetical protein CEP53_015153 [Fusarium sp. AF-6]|nr:hypothetical protein CEP53_015153 [Fusarium sp. AF-6]